MRAKIEMGVLRSSVRLHSSVSVVITKLYKCEVITLNVLSVSVIPGNLGD